MFKPLQKEILDFGLEWIAGQLSAMTLSPTILDDIQNKQDLDPSIVRIKREMLEGKCEGFSLFDNRVLKLKGGLCVLKDEELRKKDS